MVKFPLTFAGEKKAFTIEELQENGDIENLFKYFQNGKLARWLLANHYDDIYEKTSKFTETSVKELLNILDVKVDDEKVREYISSDSFHNLADLKPEKEFTDGSEIKPLCKNKTDGWSVKFYETESEEKRTVELENAEAGRDLIFTVDFKSEDEFKKQAAKILDEQIDLLLGKNKVQEEKPEQKAAETKEKAASKEYAPAGSSEKTEELKKIVDDYLHENFNKSQYFDSEDLTKETETKAYSTAKRVMDIAKGAHFGEVLGFVTGFEIYCNTMITPRLQNGLPSVFGFTTKVIFYVSGRFVSFIQYSRFTRVNITGSGAYLCFQGGAANYQSFLSCSTSGFDLVMLKKCIDKIKTVLDKSAEVISSDSEEIPVQHDMKSASFSVETQESLSSKTEKVKDVLARNIFEICDDKYAVNNSASYKNAYYTADERSDIYGWVNTKAVLLVFTADTLFIKQKGITEHILYSDISNVTGKRTDLGEIRIIDNGGRDFCYIYNRADESTNYRKIDIYALKECLAELKAVVSL